jgi:hypothetical protein
MSNRNPYYKYNPQKPQIWTDTKVIDGIECPFLPAVPAKGGRKGGYARIFIDHKIKNFHKVLIEKRVKRDLLPFETIHHIDWNKGNNSRENLIILYKNEHVLVHERGIRSLKGIVNFLVRTYRIYSLKDLKEILYYRGWREKKVK